MTSKRPTPDLSQPPDHLREPTREWFRSVCSEYELEPHHRRILVAACEAWDRHEQAREAVTEHGITYTDRFDQPRVRPEVAVERDSRLAFCRCVRELGLDFHEVSSEDVRPPRIAGVA